MRRNKIVCTIGPASRPPEVLRELIRSGMDVARLNFSHGSLAEHEENVIRIRRAAEEVGRPVAILMDLQGPKLRVGEIEPTGLILEEGQEVVFTTRTVIGRGREIPVQFAGLPGLVRNGDRILMDDGLLEVVVISVCGTEIRCQVVTGGVLHSNKGMNLPRTPESVPAITSKDVRDLAFALKNGADWIALSFVRQASEVAKLKEMIREQMPLGRPTPVISKIEKPEAMENIDAIIAESDAIMVARGDLGIETSPEAVPLMQKLMIRKCNQAGVPVITATQMLESMVQNPRPTRAEASDVANAILDGTDATMLSAETAIGAYAVQSVRMMARIADRVEAEFRSADRAPSTRVAARSIAEAVSHAACETATDLDAVAIVTPTSSGYTAKMIARHRPDARIIAVTPNASAQRQLCLVWGVEPVLTERTPTTDAMLADAISAAKRDGLVQSGDLVVMTGGAAGSPPGTTNFIKVQVVERILAQGRGIGNRGVTGRVRFVAELPFTGGPVGSPDILVVPNHDAGFASLARDAVGLVVKEDDVGWDAAASGLELAVPTIVGVQDADISLHEGQLVTLDPVNGRIYEGEVGL